MAGKAPPRIFSPARRLAARRRALSLQTAPDAPHYLIGDMIEDVLERIAFLRFEPRTALVVGDWTGGLAKTLSAKDVKVTEAEPAHGFDEERPYPFGDFDLIVSLNTMHTLNDLPGALIHIRNALAPGGMMIASFTAAGSLPTLRHAMLAADGERPAARLHPAVDVRAGGQLLQRTGFADPVIDHRPVEVAFRSLGRLIGDLRAQGLNSVLADAAPPLSKQGYARAREAFAHAGAEGRTLETFQILTLSGWKR